MIAWFLCTITRKAMSFKIFDSKDVIPIWNDVEHNELDKVMRIYTPKNLMVRNI